MKLVIQIAGGIVMALFVFAGGSMVLTYYGAKQIENAAKVQQTVQQRLLQQQEERQRQAAEQQAKLRAATEERARKGAAFSKWYQAPSECDNPVDMQALVKCADMKSAKRAEFDKLWAAGQIRN